MILADGTKMSYIAPECLITNHPKIGGFTADTRYQISKKSTDPFNVKLLPNYTSSYGETTDTTAIGADVITQTAMSVMSLTWTPIHVYNALPGYRANIREGIMALQVVSGVQFKQADHGCTGNVFLPPGWSMAQNMPFVLSYTGFSVSMNDTWTKDVLKFAIDTITSVTDGQKGQAVLQVQCGRNGIGYAPWVAKTVGEFARSVSEEYGLSTEKVTLHGVSRGGGLVLNFAAQLQEYLDVAYVKSTVPLLDITEIASPDYEMYRLPSLAFGMDIALAIPDFHIANGSHGLTAKQRTQAVLLALCGTRDVATAKKTCTVEGVWSSQQAHVLKKMKNMQFEISFGTKDGFMPVKNILRAKRLCKKFGLSCHINVGVYGSHSFNFTNEAGIYYTARWYALHDIPFPKDTATSYFAPKNITVQNGQTTFGPMEKLKNTSLPFGAAIPAIAVKEIPFTVEVSGTAGEEWQIHGFSSPERTRLNCSGIFGDKSSLVCNGLSLVRTGAGQNVFELRGKKETSGFISWTFVKNGAPINPTNTGLLTKDCHYIPAITTVLDADIPNPYGYFHPATPLSEMGLRGFGISEHSLPVTCK